MSYWGLIGLLLCSLATGALPPEQASAQPLEVADRPQAVSALCEISPVPVGTEAGYATFHVASGTWTISSLPGQATPYGHARGPLPQVIWDSSIQSGFFVNALSPANSPYLQGPLSEMLDWGTLCGDPNGDTHNVTRLVTRYVTDQPDVLGLQVTLSIYWDFDPACSPSPYGPVGFGCIARQGLILDVTDLPGSLSGGLEMWEISVDLSGMEEVIPAGRFAYSWSNWIGFSLMRAGPLITNNDQLLAPGAEDRFDTYTGLPQQGYSYSLNFGGTPLGPFAQFYFQVQSSDTTPNASRPSPPALLGPGSGNGPGEMIHTLTPQMHWVSSARASAYGLYISVGPNFDTLVYENDFIAHPSTFTIPTNVLLPGREYRWNMRAVNGSACNGGWSSTYSTHRYFRTAATATPPPTNESCWMAVNATSGSHLFSTLGAHSYGPRPAHCDQPTARSIGADIWFNYVAPSSGTLTIDTCGSGFDTVLAVYNGTTCPVTNARQIACNDDSCGLQAAVSVPVAAGESFKIRVGGFNGAVGMGRLRIELAPDDYSIGFLDPNPGLLLARTSLPGPQSPEQLLDWSPGRMAQPSLAAVRGAACDGVTRVLIRWPVPGPGAVSLSVRDEVGSTTAVGTLSLPGQPPAGSTLSAIPTIQAYDRWYAFAEYVVPNDFWRGPADDARVSRPAVFSASFAPAAGGAGLQTSKVLDLVRPPVLLLHGFLSSSARWEQTLSNDPRFVIWTENYASNSQGSFDSNDYAARNGARRAVERMRSTQCAATQVSVIGHSMGGILARLHAGNRGSNYYRYDNLGQGDIYKLITLYAPHYGSGMACFIKRMYTSSYPLGLTLIETAMPDLCVPCGGIDDLRPDSDEIRTLPAISVPTHAIAGVGGDEAAPVIALGAPVVAFLDRISFGMAAIVAFGAASSSELLGSAQHDLFVSDVSAFGGLPTSARSEVGWDLQAGVPPIVTSGLHWGAFEQANVAGLVLRPLLDAPVASPVFAPGMPANTDVPIPEICQLRGVPPFEPATNGGVAITSPVSGTTISAGDTIQVTVEATGTFAPTSVFITGPLGTAFGDSAPFTGTLTVSPDALGTYSLQAVGIDGQSRVAFSAIVPVNVTSDALLLSVETLTPWAHIGHAEETVQLVVLGSFEGPFTRDLARGATGTEYESADLGIATVDGDGLVRAHGTGQTRVFIRHGGFEVSSVVVVSAEPCRADFNSDGTPEVSDIFGFLTAWFELEPASDWDFDGLHAVSDIFAFLSEWFAGCP